MDLQSTYVTNYGTLTWSSGTLRGGNDTEVYNYGLWNAQSDQQFQNAWGGVAFFDNYGTFRKTGTSGGSSQIESGVTSTTPAHWTLKWAISV